MYWNDLDGMAKNQETFLEFLFVDINLFHFFHEQKRTTGRRSNDSIEMQPLHLQKGPKGVLRRMPRVRSDEIQETPGEQLSVRPKEIEKTPSPTKIGAGLPLLLRLRMLKEKEVSWIIF